MSKEIRKILYDNFGYGNADKAVKELLDLFAVMQRSEQLPCERCKKLEFMIENGLGWKDMENDCT